ncbi:hypothetical protein, partial [Magnetovibrio blakemorei]|uniref:hypothetical protein n=1 Tax=Magnetovibrio blakemorei TaxID=28181 RepID=UPI00147F2C93
ANDWINSAVPRNIGYTHWCLAESALKKQQPSEFVSHMKEAILLTKEAISRAEPVRERKNEQRKGLNNITYFVMRVMEQQEKGIPKLASKVILKKYITALEDIMKPMDGGVVDVFALDTLAWAHGFLGNVQKRDEMQMKTAKAVYELAQRNANEQIVTFSNLKTFLRKDLHDIVNGVAAILNPSLAGTP